jgi:hypothetical protein
LRRGLACRYSIFVSRGLRVAAALVLGRRHLPSLRVEVGELTAHPSKLRAGQDSVGDRPYEPFFLRSAQRFFIANDNRLLPSGVSPPRFLAFNADGRDVVMLVFLAVRGEFAPSNAAMARLSLSLSCFKSATILCKSKIHSFLLICQLNVAASSCCRNISVGCRSAMRRSLILRYLSSIQEK